MKKIKYIVYRYLTDVDFFNIYKPPKTESLGGGQTYIDLPTSGISILEWKSFFSKVKGVKESKVTKGPAWDFPIYSIGVPSNICKQDLKIYQRRSTTFSISTQHINRKNSKRLLAWHPNFGFPEPKNPKNRHQLPNGLAIYLIHAEDDEVWAGWFQNDGTLPPAFNQVKKIDLLKPLIDLSRQPGDAGFISYEKEKIYVDNKILLKNKWNKDSGQKKGKKHSENFKSHARTEEEIIKSLFQEDGEFDNKVEESIRTVIQKIQQRNTKAVKLLKNLYNNNCQITGTEFIFKKRDGTNYTEAHHLVPLGSGGADDPHNIIIISPLVHRMLHYANVSEIDLSKIKYNSDGSGELSFSINEETYKIKWHPEHAKRVLKT